ncbi:MAG: hypothetical protein IPH88_03905 [Bacteroidales bacterium]|nr:hypothetical protein [Bacteroidales bacterium]
MTPYLLPFRFKLIGALMVALGLLLAVAADLLHLRLELPVLAVISTYMQTRWFVVFSTNVLDEIEMLLVISGVFFMVFSRQRRELPEYDAIRNKSLALAFILNNIFLLFSVLFIYGSSFFMMLILNIISMGVFYIACFQFLKRKLKKSLTD